MLFYLCVGLLIGAFIRHMLKKMVAREVANPGALAKEHAAAFKRLIVCMSALVFIGILIALFVRGLPSETRDDAFIPAAQAEPKAAPEDNANLTESTEPQKKPSLLQSRDVVRLAGNDLAVQTHKWDGKIIETKAHCFYADINEYRCMAGTLATARIDFSSIEPDDALANIERNCDTIEKMGGKKCFVTIRFTYESFKEIDMGGLYGKMTMILAKNAEGAIVREPAVKGRSVSSGSRAGSR